MVDTPRRFLTLPRIALGVLVAGLVAMWIYVLLPSSAREPVNRLDSDAFAREAEPICAAAVGRIDALPRADTVDTPQQRAELVSQANGFLEEMLASLRGVAPSQGNDADAVDLWLTDWHTYVADREEWAASLATGQDSQFLETELEGAPISTSIDDFAIVNDMESCKAPYDV